MFWLIVGLGNPGTRYINTRHNVGFRIVERLAHVLTRDAVPSWSSKLDCQYLKVIREGATVWLIKPQKYMNLSGQALVPFLNFFKLEPAKENLIVVHDELDFDPGTVRLKDSGSAGGHNGVSDLINSLGGGEFTRIRVGIGHPRRTHNRQSLPVDVWVLSEAEGEEGVTLLEAEERAVRMIVDLLDAAR